MKGVLDLPRLGETMETGRVVAWLKRPGESFRRGETIVEIESDKTVVELPALEDGVLLEILVGEGGDVPVGASLCRYSSRGEATAASDLAEPTSTDRKQESSSPRKDEPPTPLFAGTALRATPKARRLASIAGLDLASITGSGRRGRIEAADIEAVAASVPGSGLAIHRWGSAGGSRLVLLHGFGGDAQSWVGLAKRLACAGAEVLAPDLPAHGKTRIHAASLEDLVRPVAAWLTSLDGAPAEVVGHSLGAVVAVAAAASVPVRRLSLIAPAGFGTAIDAEFVEGMASVRSPGALAHLLRRVALDPPLLSETQRAAMIAAFSGRLAGLASVLVSAGRQQLDLIGPLASLSVPARVIWGLEDQIVPWSQAANAPPTVPVHFIHGAGHMVHWDRPDVLANLLGDGRKTKTGGNDD